MDHMETNPGETQPHRTLYLETNRNGQLDRTVKSDVLLTGDFGLVYAEKTCFYNRPVESNYSSLAVRVRSNEYLSGFEQPIVLPGTPEFVPALSSFSLIRILVSESGFTVVSGDYEYTGELRSFQIGKASGGKNKGAEVQMVSPPAGLNSTDSRIAGFGIPSHIDIGKYSSLHHLELPEVSEHEQSTWLIQFHDFGKLIQQQQLRAGVPISSRWLQPSRTKEEQTIGPECDSRLLQQRSMGLPTTGY